ncbi:MmgE/PrpD family protein [Rhodococcus sp. SRB_17]|nr:MmgE/PrpD family protein [Rhodococcus sp. SRB_17]
MTPSSVSNTPTTAPIAGPTVKLATWLADVKLDQVPTHVQERAKHLILDGLTCALVGAQLPWSRLATDLVCSMEGTGTSPLIGCDRQTSAPGAALLNGTFIQGFELDDFHPQAPLHSASLVIPSLLAAADMDAPIDGANWLLATIAGFETGPRVGLALHGGQMLSRGWHSGAVFGTHASAAAAGKLWGLNVAQFEDALGLAGTQSCGLMAAQYEAMSKRMHHGFSARNGLYAAHLARGGYTGIKRVFEREYGGFLSTFGEGHNPDSSQVCAELGERWETERIVVKPYAAMGALHAPLDCLFALLKKDQFAADEVERIDVEMSHAAYHHGWWNLERPITPIAAQMNVGYALAAALIDGAAMVAQFSPQRIDSDDVWALIPRIFAWHQPEFDVGGPLKRNTTRMRVSLKDGRVLEDFRTASNTVAAPMTNDQIRRKYEELTAGLMDVHRQKDIADLVLAMDSLSDLRPLVNLLVPQVRGPFD